MTAQYFGLEDRLRLPIRVALSCKVRGMMHIRGSDAEDVGHCSSALHEKLNRQVGVNFDYGGEIEHRCRTGGEVQSVGRPARAPLTYEHLSRDVQDRATNEEEAHLEAV